MPPHRPVSPGTHVHGFARSSCVGIDSSSFLAGPGRPAPAGVRVYRLDLQSHVFCVAAPPRRRAVPRRNVLEGRRAAPPHRTAAAAAKDKATQQLPRTFRRQSAAGSLGRRLLHRAQRAGPALSLCRTCSCPCRSRSPTGMPQNKIRPLLRLLLLQPGTLQRLQRAYARNRAGAPLPLRSGGNGPFLAPRSIQIGTEGY